VPATPIVPRDREVAEIRDALLDRAVPLVTLVGPLGSGKTRLALAAAQSLHNSFRDGVAYVDLAPIPTPELVVPAIATALGVQDSGDRPTLDSITAVLRDLDLLLVIDNFEHVVAASPVVAGLLASAPRLTVMATSRAALRLAAEHQYPVLPLPVPGADEHTDLRRLRQVPSVALFALRAHAVNRRWQLGTSNAAAVAELCRRLDGLPLAIELAASGMRLMGPDALLERIARDELDVLATGARDGPPRHQTLAAAINWSYELLGPEERQLFEQLSVFAGGWTLEAAAAVGGLTVRQALGLVAGLVDKNLVYTAESAAGEPRFGMLVTLQTFAAARLAEHDQDETARARHADFFVGLAEQAEREMVGSAQRAWLARLDRDYDNVRAAFGSTLAGTNVEMALRLAGALWFFWDMRGYVREGRGWLQRVLERTDHSTSTAARIGALNAAGWLASVQNDYATAIELHEKGVQAAQMLENTEGRIRSLTFLGVALMLGPREYERASAVFGEALPLARDHGDIWAIGLTLYGQGHVAAMRGDLATATACWEETLRVSRAVGNGWAVSFLQFRWGLQALALGDLARAEASLGESLLLNQELDNARSMAAAMEALAALSVVRRQPERAVRLFGAAESLLEYAGYNLPHYSQLEHDRAVTAARAALGPDALQHLWREGRQAPRQAAVSYALGGAAATWSAIGRRGAHTGRPSSADPELSAREREVVELVSEGLSNQEVGKRLGVSRRTVDNHVARIFRKLGVRSRTALVARTLRGGAGARTRAADED